MKMMNRKRILLCVGCLSAVLVAHVVHVSRPHVRFTARFSSAEDLRIVWQPSESLLGRLSGHGQLVCTVTGAKAIELVYGDYTVYQRTRFEKQDAVAWDKSGDNRVPAFTITETVKGAQWVIDHTGVFLGSN